MTEAPEITAARIEVERSRARLMDSAHQLQHRLAPGTLAKGAWQGAKEKGADLAEDAVDAVRARPIAAGGVIAGITMFLAREPLKDLVSRLFSKSGDRKTRRKKTKDTESVE